MLKQEVKDVEMNTKSLVQAKKNADKENMELRKLLKKDLEAYGKLRSQILRQEMERMVQDKTGGLSEEKQNVLKLAVSAGSLQSRLSALRDEIATGVQRGGRSQSPPAKTGLKKSPKSAAAKARAYTPPATAKPKPKSAEELAREAEEKKKGSAVQGKKLKTAEERDQARDEAGLKPLKRKKSPDGGPVAEASPVPNPKAWLVSGAGSFKGHTRGPYRPGSGPAKSAHGVVGASTRNRTPTKPSEHGEYTEFRVNMVRETSKPMEGTSHLNVDKQEDQSMLARQRQVENAWKQETDSSLPGGLRPKREGDGPGTRPNWAVVTRDEYIAGKRRQSPHSGRDRTPPPRKAKPAVVEIPLGGRFDARVPPRDPRYSEPRFGKGGVNTRLGPDGRADELARVQSPGRSTPMRAAASPEPQAEQSPGQTPGPAMARNATQGQPQLNTGPPPPQAVQGMQGMQGTQDQYLASQQSRPKMRTFAPPTREQAQYCPLCGQGRDELEHVLKCTVAAPFVSEWKTALEHAKIPVKVESILEPPDSVLLPTLQLVQELHRMRTAAGVSGAMPSA